MITRTFGFTSPQVVTAAGALVQAVAPKGMQLTMDASWSPFAQGAVTLPRLSDAVLSSIDPRVGHRFKCTVTQANEDGSSYSMPLNIGLRSRSLDWIGGETGLSVATDEALAQDYGFATAQVYQADASRTAYAYAVDAFYFMGLALQADANAPVPTVLGADGGCDPTSSLWDWAGGLAEAAGAWLWCDEQGVAHWSPSGYAAVTSTFVVTGDTGVLAVTDTVSRDSPLFGNMAVVAYSGNSPTQYVSDSAGISPRKTLIINRPRRKPAGNAATAIRARGQKRGRTLTVVALADLRCRPNQTWQVKWGSQDRTGTVASVSFDLPLGLMTMTINVNE